MKFADVNNVGLSIIIIIIIIIIIHGYIIRYVLFLQSAQSSVIP